MSDLSMERLREACEHEGIAPIRFVQETGSTNADLLVEAAAGAPHGTALVADSQVAGRGRLGRSWSSAPGANIYLSVILRPQLPISEVPWLTLAAAVAGVEACGPVAIKWPNDLLAADGRKVAGILSEADLSAGYVVVGIGINVRAAPPYAACLQDLQAPVLDRATLSARWVSRLLYWSSVLHCGSEAVRYRWRELSCMLGKPVRVQGLEGTATDIDQRGALIVRTPDGAEHTVLAGDVEMIKYVD